jgi:precorrin-2/cobalt-factor-2 C20-methyltransferase
VLCVPISKTDKGSLAFSIVQRELVKTFETLELLFPMSSDEQVLSKHWDEATEQIVQILEQGKNVAFVTIGDPMFYSTYAYVLTRIKARHPEIKVETIPGVPAFAASTSFLNDTLCEGDEKVAIIPAAYSLEQIKEILQTFEVVVMMKVSRKFDQIVNMLGEMGLKDKAVYVSRCGYDDQFYTTDLDSLLGQTKDYMSILFIKKAGWRGL